MLRSSQGLNLGYLKCHPQMSEDSRSNPSFQCSFSSTFNLTANKHIQCDLVQHFKYQCILSFILIYKLPSVLKKFVQSNKSTITKYSALIAWQKS